MTDTRLLTKDFLIEFIELYRSHPCLWQIKSKEYSDRNKKNNAYEEMVAKMKTVDTDASRETVKKKIDSMRGCFRKEMHKIKMSRRSGAGSDDIYKPRLWYFDHLMFLNDQETPRNSVSNLEDDGSQSSEKDEPVGEYELLSPRSPLSEKPSEENISAPTPTTSQSTISSTDRFHRKAKKIKLNADDVLKKVDQKLDQSDDEFDIIGRNFANKLRKLPKEAAMMAEKFMTDIIFEAQLGNIDRNTKLNLYKNQQLPENIVVTALPNYEQLNSNPSASSVSSFFTNFSTHTEY